MHALKNQNQLFCRQEVRTIGELPRWLGERRPLPSSRSAPAAMVCGDPMEAVAAAVHLAVSGCDGLVLPADQLQDSVRRRLHEEGFTLWTPEGTYPPPAQAHSPRAHAPAGQPGRIRVLTSGTTGPVKLVPHSWDSLFTTRRIVAPAPLRWLLTYRPGTYAWYQMVTMALFVEHQALVVAAEQNLVDLVEAGRVHEATAVSSTPTFWRLATLQIEENDLGDLRLRQITLGGERVDQTVLEQLRALYPDARITHIYASTEAGACIVVTDGREGFPREWIDERDESRAPDAAEEPGGAIRTRLRVRDGVLHVRSDGAAHDQSGWIDTGDAVEIRDDRVIILGRREASIINVGGIKVAAHHVESELLRHPSVAWCRVYGRPAPLVGALVCADVVLRPTGPALSDPAGQLDRYLQALLPHVAVPRFWQFLDSIPFTEAMKSEVR